MVLVEERGLKWLLLKEPGQYRPKNKVIEPPFKNSCDNECRFITGASCRVTGESHVGSRTGLRLLEEARRAKFDYTYPKLMVSKPSKKRTLV